MNPLFFLKRFLNLLFVTIDYEIVIRRNIYAFHNKYRNAICLVAECQILDMYVKSFMCSLDNNFEQENSRCIFCLESFSFFFCINWIDSPVSRNPARNLYFWGRFRFLTRFTYTTSRARKFKIIRYSEVVENIHPAGSEVLFIICCLRARKIKFAWHFRKTDVQSVARSNKGKRKRVVTRLGRSWKSPDRISFKVYYFQPCLGHPQGWWFGLIKQQWSA